MAMNAPFAIKDIVIFGVPTEFGCWPPDYRDFFFPYYIDADEQPRDVLFVQRMSIGWAYTYVNYRFLGSGGRKNSHFGVSAIYDGIAPFEPNSIVKILRSFFDFHYRAEVIFKSTEARAPDGGPLFQFNVVSFDKVDVDWLSNVCVQLKQHLEKVESLLHLSDSQVGVKKSAVETFYFSFEDDIGGPLNRLMKGDTVALADGRTRIDPMAERQQQAISQLQAELTVFRERCEEYAAINADKEAIIRRYAQKDIDGGRFENGRKFQSFQTNITHHSNNSGVGRDSSTTHTHSNFGKYVAITALLAMLIFVPLFIFIGGAPIDPQPASPAEGQPVASDQKKEKDSEDNGAAPEPRPLLRQMFTVDNRNKKNLTLYFSDNFMSHILSKAPNSRVEAIYKYLVKTPNIIPNCLGIELTSSTNLEEHLKKLNSKDIDKFKSRTDIQSDTKNLFAGTLSRPDNVISLRIRTNISESSSEACAQFMAAVDE